MSAFFPAIYGTDSSCKFFCGLNICKNKWNKLFDFFNEFLFKLLKKNLENKTFKRFLPTVLPEGVKALYF